MKKSLALTLGAVATVAATPALAHTGIGATVGLFAGLEHPVSGLDHLLAMIAVGVWSALVVPDRVWAPPATFMGAMLVGAGLFFAGIHLPMVEAGIALSVLLFGLMVATRVRLGTGIGLAVIALFAVMHGHAHGSEAAGLIGGYMAGFTLTTGTLHLVGIGIGKGLARSRLATAVLGVSMAAAGVAMLAG